MIKYFAVKANEAAPMTRIDFKAAKRAVLTPAPASLLINESLKKTMSKSLTK